MRDGAFPRYAANIATRVPAITYGDMLYFQIPE